MDSRHNLRRHRTVLSLAFALMAGVVACGEKGHLPESLPSGASHAFDGSWTASGTRHTLHLGGDRQASIISVSGSMLLTGDSRPGVGFRAEAIAFVDDGLVGRAVWTDERGEQVFSELKGEKVITGNRITGTITGGTGRYDGAAGEYGFQWQYVVEAEQGTIQGRAIGLKGRIRRGGSEIQSETGGKQP
ncbi:MAG TPA: hypothetical protein VJT81_10525 [Burkholderiales bacterium]|nr:hypothetical protein [Burkholderiales bacterium]